LEEQKTQDYIHTHIHTYIHTYKHTHIHTYRYVSVYIHTYIHTYVSVYDFASDDHAISMTTSANGFPQFVYVIDILVFLSWKISIACLLVTELNQETMGHIVTVLK